MGLQTDAGPRTMVFVSVPSQVRRKTTFPPFPQREPVSRHFSTHRLRQSSERELSLFCLLLPVSVGGYREATITAAAFATIALSRTEET